MEDWIARRGRLGILLGCLVEGETTILERAIFAKFGYLGTGQVITCPFLGTVLGDSTFFYLGRHFGRPLAARFRPLARRTHVAHRVIDRYGNLIVGIMRLLASFRAAVLVFLGSSRLGTLLFLALDLLASAGWALLISLLGCSFAHEVYMLVADVKRYEGVTLPGIALLAVSIILFYRHAVKKKEEEEKSHGD